MRHAEELVDWTTEEGLREIEERIASYRAGAHGATTAYDRMVRVALPQLVEALRAARDPRGCKVVAESASGGPAVRRA